MITQHSFNTILPAAPLPSAPVRASSPAPAPASRPLSDDDERLRAELSAELSRTNGNVSKVARTMGKTRMQIHRWMKRFNITPESFRSG